MMTVKVSWYEESFHWISFSSFLWFPARFETANQLPAHLAPSNFHRLTSCPLSLHPHFTSLLFLWACCLPVPTSASSSDIFPLRPLAKPPSLVSLAPPQKHLTCPHVPLMYTCLILLPAHCRGGAQELNTSSAASCLLLTATVSKPDSIRAGYHSKLFDAMPISIPVPKQYF